MPNAGQLLEELQFGDVSGGNTSTIETTGFIRANGDAIAWRDEYPSTLLPAGAQASPDSENYTIGGIARTMYSFNGQNTEESLSGSFEIPHDYASGGLIEVHIHYRPTTNDAGNVKWFFDWEYSPANGAPEAQTGLSVVDSIAANEQYYHKLKTFGNLPENGYTLGDKIGFDLRRDPSDAEDTYGSDVMLEQVALHVPVDTKGSRQIYVK